MGIGLEYMERLSKQQERVKAQRKRIESQRRQRAKHTTVPKSEFAEDTTYSPLRRRCWKVVAPQKETEAISTLGQEKKSKLSAEWDAKWDRRRAKWDRRARKHGW
jgi:hypothetical protein